MPYIKPEDRPALDELLKPIIKHLSDQSLEKLDGSVNYAFTKILHGLYDEKYFEYNRALGVVSAVQHELYRKKVAPYEDKKIQENGDV